VPKSRKRAAPALAPEVDRCAYGEADVGSTHVSSHGKFTGNIIFQTGGSTPGIDRGFGADRNSIVVERHSKGSER
jgi:hypothetical protein